MSADLLPADVRLILPSGIHSMRIDGHLEVTLDQEMLPIGELRHRSWRDGTFSEFRHHPAWGVHRRHFHVSPELRPTLSRQWRKPPKAGGRNVLRHWRTRSHRASRSV